MRTHAMLKQTQAAPALIVRPARPEPIWDAPGFSPRPFNFANLAIHPPLQAKLQINAPKDALEQEADAVAEKVLRSEPVQVTTGATAKLRRACAACRDDDELQRKEAGAATRLDFEDKVAAVQGGRPLTDAERVFFEPRFGSDFSQVRIHTNTQADIAANSVGALAYTRGHDIVFRQGSFDFGSHAGRHLLAHELTHVIQQGAASPTHGSTVVHQRAANGTLSRRGPLVRVPVRVVPMPRPPVRAGTGAASGPWTTGSVPYHQLYAPPPDWDHSLHALMYRASVQREREAAILDGQTPYATLSPGGAPPSFVTDGPTQSAIGEGYHVSYTTRQFHILDAITYEVGRANTEADLERIVSSYLADTILGRALLTERYIVSRGRIGPVYVFRSWRLPVNLDPEGERRLGAYARAVGARVATAPLLRQSPLAARYADMLLIDRVQQQPGPCRTRNVPRRGGHARHDEYARHVTGSTEDFEIGTPEGLVCVTDGLDPHGQTWEVKTGYRYLSDSGIIWSLEIPRFTELIAVLEEQRARCVYVTARCGYPYAYAFDDAQTADFMRRQWSNLPPVYYLRPPYAP